MKTALREEAIRLRKEEEMSYGEIRKRLGISKSTLSYWLQYMPLPSRRMRELRGNAWTVGEARREQFRATMRAKRDREECKVYAEQKKHFREISDEAAFVAGLMLYAAEGEKKSRCEIAFTNTDPALVRFFQDWAMNFLEVSKDRFRIQLHLYENMDVAAEESFWMKTLDLMPSQLWKSRVQKLRPKSFSYRDTSRHGTCKLYVGDTIKKTKMMLSIRAFFDRHRELRA